MHIVLGRLEEVRLRGVDWDGIKNNSRRSVRWQRVLRSETNRKSYIVEGSESQEEMLGRAGRTWGRWGPSRKPACH